MTDEQIIRELQARNKLREAATLIDPYWEDDYSENAVKSGRPDYSILDLAADVVREGIYWNRCDLESLILLGCLDSVTVALEAVLITHGETMNHGERTKWMQLTKDTRYLITQISSSR